MKITWLGHSAFRIEIEQAVLLVDPWLQGNPMFPAERLDEALQGATHILLTHGHGDHAGDAVEFSTKLDIPIVCIHEMSDLFASEGSKTIGFGKGGTVDLNGALVTLVNACHSSSIDFRNPFAIAGSEAGFMIAGEGHTIYVSGDTDIMADMEWMGDYHKPDIGILACGGHYTMDQKRAAYACRKWFDFKVVIPCHYKTFGLLAQTTDDLRDGLPKGTKLLAPAVLEPVSF